MNSYPDKLLLIDTSSVVYRNFHAVPEMHSSSGFPTNALLGTMRTVDALVREHPSARIVAVMDSPGPSFRKELYPKYKANRSAMPDDLLAQFKALDEILLARGITIARREGMEADDVIATIARRYHDDFSAIFILTLDKDLAQLVDERVRMIYGKDNVEMDVAAVREKFAVEPGQILDYLSLIGDTSDNIPGVPGIGVKSAVKILAGGRSVDEFMRTAADGDKFAAKIAASLDDYRLARSLIVLKDDIDLADNVLAAPTPDFDRLSELYREYELRSLQIQLQRDTSAAASAAASASAGVSGAAASDSDGTSDSGTGGGASGSMVSSTAAASASASGTVGGARTTADGADDAGTSADILTNAPLTQTPAGDTATDQAPAPVDLLGFRLSLVDDPAALQEMCTELSRAKLISLDCETTGLDYGRDHLVGLALAIEPDRVWYIPMAHRDDQAKQLPVRLVLNALAPILNASDIAVLAHNLKFDSNVLYSASQHTSPAHIAAKNPALPDTTAQNALLDNSATQNAKHDNTVKNAKDGNTTKTTKDGNATQTTNPDNSTEGTEATKPDSAAKPSGVALGVASLGGGDAGQEAVAIDMKGVWHDTMLQACLLKENPGQRAGLDALALQHLGRENISYDFLVKRQAKRLGKSVRLVNFADVPVAEAAEYCAEDAVICLRLHSLLHPQILSTPWRARSYKQVDVPLARILARMERRGIYVNRRRLMRAGEKFLAKIDSTRSAIEEIAGRAVNPDSPKQLGMLLFDKLQLPVFKRTGGRQPSTDASVLARLAREFPAVELPQLVLDFRAARKLKSTYVDDLLSRADAQHPRIHTHFQQGVTLTGRLSSDSPNLQNIPVRSEDGLSIRAAFTAGKGFCLQSFDYSQIELRVIAHFSQDDSLVRAFKAGEDIHSSTAAEIFGIKLDDVDSNQRRVAKTINFGLVYGMTSHGLAGHLGLSFHEAQNYINMYFERYPGVKEYMEHTRVYAREHGNVESLLGRRIPIGNINDRNAGRRQHAERVAINAPVQGSGADIISRAMIAVNERGLAFGDDYHLLLQVHDELLFEVRTERAKQFSAEITEVMSTAADLCVPLVVNAATGADWAKLSH